MDVQVSELEKPWTPEELKTRLALFERINKISIDALQKKGHERQVGKFFEELHECGSALAQFWWDERSIEKVQEELADLSITLHQMRLLFGALEVEGWIVKKLDRFEAELAESPDAPEDRATAEAEGHQSEGPAESGEVEVSGPKEGEGFGAEAAGELFAALLTSQVFTDALARFPIEVVSESEILGFEDWTPEQLSHAKAWAEGVAPFPPIPIVNYLAKLDHLTHERARRAKE